MQLLNNKYINQNTRKQIKRTLNKEPSNLNHNSNEKQNKRISIYYTIV
jgi:hypothetical protein